LIFLDLPGHLFVLAGAAALAVPEPGSGPFWILLLWETSKVKFGTDSVGRGNGPD